MAFAHGRKAVIKIDNSSGTPADLSAYCDAETLSRQADAAETTTFGDDNREYIAGLKGATFSVSGKWDPTLDSHMDAILGLIGTVDVSPAGSTTGLPKYTAEALCTNYDVDGSFDDVVTWSAEFTITGAVTRGTNA